MLNVPEGRPRAFHGPLPSASLAVPVAAPLWLERQSVGTPRHFILMPAHRPGGQRLRAAAMWVVAETTFPRFALECSTVLNLSRVK